MNDVARETEAYVAGRLAGFEEGLVAGAGMEPDWDRLARAWALVFAFVPDKSEIEEIKRQYAALAGLPE